MNVIAPVIVDVHVNGTAPVIVDLDVIVNVDGHGHVDGQSTAVIHSCVSGARPYWMSVIASNSRFETSPG